MRHLKPSPGLILAVLLALILLSACGASASAPTAIPTVSTPPVAGEFVGVTNNADAIGLSTNGQQIIAYACDGTATHAVTFAVWFKGAVNHNAVDLTAKNGEHLVATLTPQSATGIVTLTGGKSFSFTANVISDTMGAGLYRSEQTFGGVPYLAGWIIPTKPAMMTPTPASSASASVALLSGQFNPSSPKMIGPEPEGGRGGILNEKTGALLSLPALTDQDLAARRVTVPNLAIFPMTQCHLGACS